MSAFSHAKLSNEIADVGNGVLHPQPNGSLPPLQTYVNEISAAAETLTAYCAENSLPHPAFDPEAPSTIVPPSAPLDVQAARQKIIASSTRIQQVVLEPTEYLPNLAINVRLVSCGFVLTFVRCSFAMCKRECIQCISAKDVVLSLVHVLVQCHV